MCFYRKILVSYYSSLKYYEGLLIETKKERPKMTTSKTPPVVKTSPAKAVEVFQHDAESFPVKYSSNIVYEEMIGESGTQDFALFIRAGKREWSSEDLFNSKGELVKRGKLQSSESPIFAIGVRNKTAKTDRVPIFFLHEVTLNNDSICELVGALSRGLVYLVNASK